VLSSKNDNGPHTGTCKQYLDLDSGQIECIDDKDCLGYSNVKCRDALCYCGETRFDLKEIEKSRPSVCEGTTIVYPGSACVDGKITERKNTGSASPEFTDCAKNGQVCKPSAYFGVECGSAPPPGP